MVGSRRHSPSKLVPLEAKCCRSAALIVVPSFHAQVSYKCPKHIEILSGLACNIICKKKNKSNHKTASHRKPDFINLLLSQLLVSFLINWSKPIKQPLYRIYCSCNTGHFNTKLQNQGQSPGKHNSGTTEEKQKPSVESRGQFPQATQQHYPHQRFSLDQQRTFKEIWVTPLTALWFASQSNFSTQDWTPLRLNQNSWRTPNGQQDLGYIQFTELEHSLSEIKPQELHIQLWTLPM